MELNASQLRWDNERGFGVVYLLVTALGFVAPALTASLLAINAADNFLHLVLGIVLAGVGFRRPIKSNGVRSNPMKGFAFPLVLVSAPRKQ